MASGRGTIRVGVSGWSYDPWRGGAFYPERLPRKRELAWLARQFNSAEVNGSFYGLLRPETWERYREAAPRGFVFAVKGSRFITHNKKLAGVETPLANFWASGLLRLESALGPVLWQLPATEPDVERIERFLGRLPHGTEEASRLARRHDARMKGRASMAVHRNRRMRHVLEVRHPAALGEDVVRACRRNGVALCISHAGDWPLAEELTAGFAYVRLHGAPRTYASRYGDGALERWSRRIRAWSRGEEPGDAGRITDREPPRRKTRDVYVYFDNDAEVHAPHDARRLMDRLGVEAPGAWDDEAMEPLR
jgi:uncharacterized protein YecE (DUF72 family)